MRGQFNMSPMNIVLVLTILLVSFIIIYGFYIYLTEGTVVATDNILFSKLGELGVS